MNKNNNISNEKKRYNFFSYLKETSQKFSIFSILLLSTIIYFSICVFDKFDILGHEHSLGKLNYIFILVCCGVLVLSILGTVLFFIDRKKIMFIDILLPSIAISSIATIVDTIITHGVSNDYSIHYFIYCILFVFSLFSMICRINILRIKARESMIVYTMNNAKTYYLTLFRKYSFILPVFMGVGFALFLYILIENKMYQLIVEFFEKNAGTKDETIFTIAIILTVVIFLLYSCVDCTRKKLCMFDLFLLSWTISLPFLFFELFIFGFTDVYLATFIALTVFCVFFTIMRINNIDLLYEDKFKQSTLNIKNLSPFRIYYKSIFSRRSIFSALTIASFISNALLLSLFTDFIKATLEYTLSITGAYLYYTTIFLLFLIAIITFITMIFMIACCKCKRILFTDYILFIILAIDVFSISTIYYKTNIYMVILFLFVLVFCIAITLTRIKYTTSSIIENENS